MNGDHDPFLPPHCPNANCLYHKPFTPGWQYKKAGFFGRHLKPNRIQRFTCRHCRRSFSSQSFATTYWLKRPDILFQLFTKTTGCMSNRQVARDLNVAPSTIDNQLSRLARHCMLFHAKQMQTALPARTIVFDSFVSFEFSQYWPLHHHLAVEKDTDFILYFTDSEVRRSGTMTAQQKRRRQQLEAQFGRPDPQAVHKDVTELLEVVTAGSRRVILLSDEHRVYPRVIQALSCEVEHRVTSSRERRDADNPLWEVNLVELLVRHSSANHKRETIAWSKRRQSSSERLAIFLVFRNYLKGRREKQRGSPTPAQTRGMLPKRLGVQEVLRERLFPSLIALPGRWERYYKREIKTRVLRRQRRHDLSYAQ